MFHRPSDPAVSMAVALGVLAWPLDFFLEGGFNMSNWGFAFPLDALAAASVVAYNLSGHETIKVRHNNNQNR